MITEKRLLINGASGSTKKPKIVNSKPITDFFRKTSSKPTTSEVDEKAGEANKKAIKDETEVETKKIGPAFPDATEFKKQFITKLSDEQKELLDLEINTLEDSWFQALSTELLKPYFLNLKKFLKTQLAAKQTIFPPQNDIYSWSRLTPLNSVKAIILGQDPYHNFNQAHGLAFSVKSPTPPPPSLRNMYKALKIDYPEFVIPTGDGAGDLTKWADRGVLLLNTCLTVKAHEANSHAKKGWEQFTEVVLQKAIQSDKKMVLFLWGNPAQKRVEKMKLDPRKVFVLKSVHPSPLSASRGYFEGHHYVKCNEWLIENGEKPIDWSLVDGNILDYTKQ